MQTEKIVQVIPAAKQGNSKIRVAAYCRVSTDSSDQANSLFAQVKYYNDFIRANENMVLTDIYADEGITGTSISKRDEFKRLVNDVKKKRIDRVYVKSVTRFARNSLECLETARLFNKYGTSIFFENDNITTEGMNSEMILYVKSAFAQCEAVSASKRMATSIRMRMADGTFNMAFAPYGYKIVDERFEIVPEEADNVRKIYALALSGMGVSQITKYMQENDDSIEWGINHIRYILRNEKYVGDCLFQKRYTPNEIPFRIRPNNGEVPQYYYENSHEPIITREMFDAVKLIRAQRKEKYTKAPTGKKQFFSGKIKCRKCGWKFKYIQRDGTLYWKCSKKDKHSVECDTHIYADDTIKKAFVVFFNKLKQNKALIIHEAILQLQTLKYCAHGMNVELAEIDEEINITSGQLEVFTDLYQGGIFDEITYFEQTDELKHKLTELRSRRLQLLSDDEENGLELLKELERCLSNNDYIMRFDKQLFDEIVELIYVEQGGALSFCCRCGLTFSVDMREVI